MALVDHLDWHEVRGHYDHRVDVHRELLRLHAARQVKAFAELALGISDAAGNYSASEHGLGPKIVATNKNAHQEVFDLASQFAALTMAAMVPPLVRSAAITFLAIGVGSELSCMMNPKRCWVANTRTIWSHLLIKNKGNYDTAEEELELYRDDDASSKMHYDKWIDLHRRIEPSLTNLAKQGNVAALAARVKPGPLAYLWADAIASFLYAERDT